MKPLKLLALIGILLIALPASANHGVEAVGDGLIQIAKYVILTLLVGGILITSIVLRFALRKQLFSIGVYLSGLVVILFTFANYSAALEEFESRQEIADSYPMSMVSEIMQTAQDQLSGAALWFYTSIFFILAYLALDLWVARRHKLNKGRVS